MCHSRPIPSTRWAARGSSATLAAFFVVTNGQALVAAWTAGYGVPPTEYTALYEQRDRMEPLPFSQYWIGTYTGDRRGASVWMTPFVIDAKGAGSPPDIPSGFAMTLVVGKLVVQGVQFTTPALQVDLVAEWGSLDICPPQELAWSGGCRKAEPSTTCVGSHNALPPEAGWPS